MLTIKKSNEFQNAFQHGKWYHAECLVIYVNKNNLETNRIGIAVGKKIAKSVKRNRIRRVIREAYRSMENQLLQGYDIIIVWKNGVDMENACFLKVEENLASAFKKANLLME
ncbi:MAG: ribonuclease P protein component [Clostridia bacterium]|nr:ribonuclease P protein component [Clostridia bacterium]